MIKVSNLTKKYGEQTAVDNISFEAKKGEILGFLGSNGAGKSTTMKIATCYLPPTKGSVTVCGHQVTKNPLEVKKLIGYLPEHNPLYLDMYVKEYLSFVGKVHNIKGKKVIERTNDIINLVGLEKEKNKQIGVLSKGYKQRVGLGAALIHEPQVLILDEPTTGLDPNQIQEIRKVIKDISKEKTVVFSTHIMQEVQVLCDRVIIINQGEIVADDKVSNLQLDQSGVRIIVEFTQKIQIKVFTKIKEITQIEKIKDKLYAFHINNKKGHDESIRAEIFKVAAENELVIIGMYRDVVSLESVFKKLTS